MASPRWAASAIGFEHVVALVERLAGTPQLRSATAAVLVPVYERHGDPVVLLTRRSSALARDPGHVAFPGGFVEAGEHTLQAALREAQEEVGLDPALATATGLLGPYSRRSRSELVAAYVAVLAAPPQLAIHSGEVEAVIEAPLKGLLAEGVCWQERWGGRPMCFFADESSLGDDLVWGLTARILWDMLAALVMLAVP